MRPERRTWNFDETKPDDDVILVFKNEEMANRVVQAVNSHDDLVKACEAAKKYLEPDLVEPGRTVFWQLVSALAKAKGA